MIDLGHERDGLYYLNIPEKTFTQFSILRCSGIIIWAISLWLVASSGSQFQFCLCSRMWGLSVR